MLRTVLFLFCGAVLLSCQSDIKQSEASSPPTEGEVKVVADTSVRATVRSYAATAWCGEGLSGAVLYQASSIYRYENCEEVQETLEITDVRSAGAVTAAFLRYSIGTKVFRKALWFRKVGDKYAVTGDRPMTYSDEEDWSSEAIELAEEADKWKKESATWHE